MANDVDVLILGGGCAGLSLAWRLAALGTHCPKVMILEKRSTYVNDRTWCFWDNNDTRLAGLLTHQWRWLKLRSRSKTVRFDCGSNAYQMLAASSFYDCALQAIRACPAITLVLEQAVDGELTQGPGGWTAATARGDITARAVVDTRPTVSVAAGGATLWQSFYGHEVCCDTDVFTPEAAQLMDFTAGAQGQIPFIYVLPITARRALIEATVFGPEPLGPALLAAKLDAAVQQHTAGSTFEVVRRESGILPMGLTHRPPSLGPGHVAVGVMAGGARASSGFAFQRIQQWAQQCGAAIADGRHPTPHRADPPLVRLMDQLFLRVLRDAPHAAPDLFLSLFERADPASLVRFLSGSSTVQDCLRVVNALPARVFVRQLFHGSTAWRWHPTGGQP